MVMMANKIRILIADDTTSRERIGKLFELSNDVVVVGQAASSEDVIQQTKAVHPDIILIDVDLPSVGGIAATELLISEVPSASVILMSSQFEQNDLRNAMLAGAKDYVIKPFSYDEILQALIRVSAKKHQSKGNGAETEEGKIITVFSTKGGVGKTMLTTNLAVALAEKFAVKVAIVDCDLQFGDISICLNVMPKASIVDMVTDIEHLDENVLSRYMVSFSDKLHVLPAPFQPEDAEKVTSKHLASVFKLLKKQYQFIVVDTAPIFSDATLASVDFADLILVVTAPDLTTTKNVKLCLETLETLGYAQEKVEIVVNRANTEGGLSIKEMEITLHRQFIAAFPNENQLVVSSVNKGIPFVISQPSSPIAKEVFNLANKIIEAEKLKSAGKETAKVVDAPAKGMIVKFKNLFK